MLIMYLLGSNLAQVILVFFFINGKNIAVPESGSISMDHILFFVNCIKLVWENITHMAHSNQEGGKDLTFLILNKHQRFF